METKWKFETEEKDYSFFIYTENNDFEEAFDLAYEAYGPQVYDMYYWIEECDLDTYLVISKNSTLQTKSKCSKSAKKQFRDLDPSQKILKVKKLK